MLAYVFWHWPGVEAAASEYERRLLAFHADRAHRRPPGFLGSAVFAVLDPVPWAPDVPHVYEDWYILENSAGLDVLNDAALAGSRGAVHDDIAVLAAGGTAGLYRLRQGAPVLTSTIAYWFAKPAGTTYAELYRILAPACARPATGLWGRQMVLGPTPEFCLLAASDIELLAALKILKLRRDVIWAEI